MSASLELMHAEIRMGAAKRQLTEAARAALAGDPRAAELAKIAVDEIAQAQAALQALRGGGIT